MTNKERVYKYLTETAKFTPAAVCGIMANIAKESGFRTDASGDSGTSYGLCQWHNGRKNNLINYCKSYNLDVESVEGQCAFIVHELTKTVYYKHLVGKYVLAAENTADEAYLIAARFCKYYEAPKNATTSAVTRGNLAREYFNALTVKAAADAQNDAQEAQESATPKAEAVPHVFTVGETITFNGYLHYRSANAKAAYTCKSGTAKILRIYRLGKSAHPYKIKGVKPCTANGWVNAEDIAAKG